MSDYLSDSSTAGDSSTSWTLRRRNCAACFFMGQLTQQLAALNIPPLHATESTPAEDKTIHARLFALASTATWFIAEFDVEEQVALGFVDLGDPTCAEWGYISVAALESLRWLGVPRVEFDVHFTPIRFTDLK
ncbi:MAG: DUF2958 domain-containing protein [Armatimonadetes bacterium]|nr:DUF2958 domain-containing protein [Armatimonadota bacterium]MBX3109963.1 DUF2958 domain-containing protein [Fimbriimonadaceae bacterium]